MFSYIIASCLFIFVVFYFNSKMFSNIVMTVLIWSLLLFFSSIAILLYVNVEFLAIAMAVIYIGGILVIFLFFVLTMNVNNDEIKELKNEFFGFYRFVVLILVLSCLLTFFVLQFFYPVAFTAQEIFTVKVPDHNGYWDWFYIVFHEWLYEDFFGYGYRYFFDVPLKVELYEWNFYQDINESFMIGVYLFADFREVLYAFGFLLFVATIVPLFIITGRPRYVRQPMQFLDEKVVEEESNKII